MAQWQAYVKCSEMLVSYFYLVIFRITILFWFKDINTVGIQFCIGYISLRCTMQWFDICRPCNVITPLILILVIICHHANLSLYHWLYSSALFYLSPPPPPIWSPSLWFVSICSVVYSLTNYIHLHSILIFSLSNNGHWLTPKANTTVAFSKIKIMHKKSYSWNRENKLIIPHHSIAYSSC